MGPPPSTTSSIENTFNFSAISENITNIITEKSNTTTATGANIQGMTVNLGDIIGCDMNFSQKITSKTMTSSDFDDTDIAKLQSAITSDMSASAASALEKNTQMGSELGQLVSGETNTQIKTEVDMEIKNLVENNITTKTVNNTVAEQVNIQDNVLHLKRYDCSDTGAKLDLSQDIMAEVKATSIMKILKEAVASNEMLNKMASVADSAAKDSKGGYAQVVDSAGGAVAGIGDSLFGGIAGVVGSTQQGAQTASLASMCCVCVIVLGGVAVAMSPAGQNAGRAAAAKF